MQAASGLAEQAPLGRCKSATAAWDGARARQRTPVGTLPGPGSTGTCQQAPETSRQRSNNASTDRSTRPAQQARPLTKRQQTNCCS